MLGWTTKDEKTFLDGLGSYRETGYSYRTGDAPQSRTELLRRYIEIAPNRQRWGQIDPYVAVEHARHALAQQGES
jgi:hypothetical protein